MRRARDAGRACLSGDARTVLEPATEAVLAEVPRAGVDGGRRGRRARPRRRFPAWRAVAPGDRARAAARRSPTRWRAPRGARRCSRRATPASRSATPAARWAWSSRPSATTPARPSGCSATRSRSPAAGLHGPRAARRRRADRAVELPAGDRRLEAGAGAGGRQHRRAQAGRADAADRAALRRARAGGRAARGRGQRRRRARAATCGAAAGRAPRRRQDRLHRLDRGRALDRRRRRADDQARDAGAGRQVAPTSSSPTPTSRRPRRPRRGRCSATPARTAARARGSSSQREALDEFMAALEGAVDGDPRRRPARRGDPDGAADLRRPARDGRVVRRRRRAGGDPRQRARRARASGSPPTVLCPVDPGDRAAREEIFGPVAVRDPVRRRGGGGRAGQRHDLRAVGLDLDARRRAGAARRAGAGDRRAVDQLEHLGARVDAVRRLQAVRLRPRARARTRSTPTPRSRSIYYATEGTDAGRLDGQGLRRSPARPAGSARATVEAVRSARARRWSASTCSTARRASSRSRPTSPTSTRSQTLYARVRERVRAHRRAVQQRRHLARRRRLGARDRRSRPGSACRTSTCEVVFLCCKHGIPHLLENAGGGLGHQHRVVRRGDGRGDLADLLHRLQGRRAGAVARARRRVRARAACASTRCARARSTRRCCSELFAKDPEQAARRLVHVPMGRFAQRRGDRQRASLFLASDESSLRHRHRRSSSTAGSAAPTSPPSSRDRTGLALAAELPPRAVRRRR